MDEDQVNATIRRCLQLCYQVNDTLAAVAAFLADLKSTGEWREDEIRIVEVGVLRVLSGIVIEPESPGDAMIPAAI